MTIAFLLQSRSDSLDDARRPRLNNDFLGLVEQVLSQPDDIEVLRCGHDFTKHADEPHPRGTADARRPRIRTPTGIFLMGE
jgi:hypothetical protein